MLENKKNTEMLEILRLPTEQIVNLKKEQRDELLTWLSSLESPGAFELLHALNEQAQLLGVKERLETQIRTGNRLNPIARPHSTNVSKKPSRPMRGARRQANPLLDVTAALQRFTLEKNPEEESPSNKQDSVSPQSFSKPQEGRLFEFEDPHAVNAWLREPADVNSMLVDETYNLPSATLNNPNRKSPTPGIGPR